ncbi:MAG: hypothetical protein H7330_05950 [Hymenobacteraceae bacterium]|nr:hypothetical protein [Hymenobacteraceae bacterium]
MANHSNNSGETLHVAAVLSMATIVGLLLFVQLIRAKPIDLFFIVVIAVCFVVAVIVTAMWGDRSGG